MLSCVSDMTTNVFSLHLCAYWGYGSISLELYCIAKELLFLPISLIINSPDVYFARMHTPHMYFQSAFCGG